MSGNPIRFAKVGGNANPAFSTARWD